MSDSPEDPPPIEIRLKVRAKDFGSGSGSDEDYGCGEQTFPVTVRHVGPDLYELLEPCSITMFGALGAQLRVGTIMKTVPDSDGSHRYVRAQSKARGWTRVLHVGPHQILEDAAVKRTIERLQEMDCGWEYFVGNITIQGKLPPGKAEPADAIVAVVSELGAAVAAATCRFPDPPLH